ncbi:hypothetical protein GCM10010253_61480 [Streptomyces badius]|uniref:Uncharacterized protein n=1 Tax=Streptomyces badius TaxID=1941 RepID=A0ABQ2TMM7_STRBA|nr:hypothetical protein GCM10010253_61480 [Streptomyces badius]
MEVPPLGSRAGPHHEDHRFAGALVVVAELDAVELRDGHDASVVKVLVTPTKRDRRGKVNSKAADAAVSRAIISNCVASGGGW